jgi:hypothetical protein
MKKAFALSPRWLASAAVLTALLGFAVSPNAARADTIYTLTTGNAGLAAAVTPPYGTVDVHLVDSTHATVTFTGGSGTTIPGGAPATYRFGGAQAIDVNVNGTATTSALVSSSGSTLTDSGSGNVSTFGTFNHTIDNTDGAGDSFTTGSFLLTKASGTWASDADVLTKNDGGFYAAAHIFAFGADGQVIVTGFAATPEFGSVSLMGLMLLGFGGIAGARRFRKPAMA